jgi:hypothetical protein
VERPPARRRQFCAAPACCRQVLLIAAGALALGVFSIFAASPASPQGLLPLAPSDTPVTPGASPQVQSLLAYFNDTYGKKIISGQQDGAVWEKQPEFEFDLIKKITGKVPAIRAFEMAPFTPPPAAGADSHRPIVTRRAIDWYQNQHGIVALCWHWHAPTGPGGIYIEDTPFDIRQAVIEGTPEHTAVLRDLDAIAGELKQLQDAGVPVLWRPLHEANGRWFWWGAHGPQPFKQFWHLMYERFTGYHKLNNLIWVFSPGSATDLAEWYPGDPYVDIIGQDHYPMDGNNGPAKDVFDQLVAFGHGNKLIGLSENGPIPAPDRLVSEKAGWLFFVTWSGRTLTQKNSNDELAQAFNHPYVVNLGDLPDLKHYPFHPAGEAVKLGFAVAPEELAVGSPGRQPVIVAVQDAQGRTVRAGSFDVNLALEAHPDGGILAPNPATMSTNGLAMFSNLKISKAGQGYAVKATAKNLVAAISPPFEVGPGTGLLREWWTGISGSRIGDLTNHPGFGTAPAGREVLGAAFEVPCILRTNFGERIRGAVSPPVTGSYRFEIVSDGASELWLSSDATPGRKTKIAEITGQTPYSKWPHSHEAWSAPVSLEASRQYYIEALHQQAGGFGQLWVSWLRPDGLFQQPIPGARFSRPVDGESALNGFIKTQGDQLLEAGKPFRFISFNLPNLQLIEDDVAFAKENPWRLPDRFEITDALESVRQAGGTVARLYALSVARTNDLPGTPRHVLGPGRFNEEAFRALDEVLEVANQTGIRLIVPLVDNWIWMGGRAEYAGFRGKSKDDFWTDPQVIADFEQTINFVISRTNTLTGVPYRDDKAVLCWETGNELESPPSWTRQIAAYIKGLDTNHLVMDGFNASELRDESLAIPEVDIVTTHHYPGGGGAFPGLVRQNWGKAKGKKPYIIGEFGFVDTAVMAETMEAVMQTGASGALLWSLRFRNRDGGFYWHSEPAGGNKYKAFHWPGFASGADYDEENLLALVRRNAFAIRGLPMPDLPPPASPRLLPVADAAAISWQGSVGATSYAVERAADPAGPWLVVGDNVDETAVQYRPLFADARAPKGAWFYRVRARNRSGVSAPSNVAGPVLVEQAVLVDEMAGFSLVHARQGQLETRTRDCRKVKEDAHRIAGWAGSALVYRLPSAISSAKVFAFFPYDAADLKFAASSDGQSYTEIAATKEACSQGGGDYGSWMPVLYQSADIVPSARFLKIQFTGETQLGRAEIRYSLDAP